MIQITRKSYLLTCDPNSERTQFSKNILERVGFCVNLINCILHNNKVLSNKLSMLYIYDLIANGLDEWVYVFEDDINILKDIKIDEIIQYEKISDMFFYIGVCVYSNANNISTNKQKINNQSVSIVKGGIRGLHAIGLSKHGAIELLMFAKKMEQFEYMDMILENFSKKYPANIVMYDLESYIPGHRGVFFQDRKKFDSIISHKSNNIQKSKLEHHKKLLRR